MKQPKNGGEFWGFTEDTDEDSYSFDEDEENTAGFKPILKVKTKNSFPNFNSIQIRKFNIVLLINYFVIG